MMSAAEALAADCLHVPPFAAGFERLRPRLRVTACDAIVCSRFPGRCLGPTIRRQDLGFGARQAQSRV